MDDASIQPRQARPHAGRVPQSEFTGEAGGNSDYWFTELLAQHNARNERIKMTAPMWERAYVEMTQQLLDRARNDPAMAGQSAEALRQAAMHEAGQQLARIKAAYARAHVKRMVLWGASIGLFVVGLLIIWNA